MLLREIKYREDKQLDFSQFPFNLPVFKNPELNMQFKSPITFLVGENGSGKSTLLEAISLSCGFNASGGSRDHAYQSIKTESQLSDYLKLVWNKKINKGFFMRAETFFNFASEVDKLGSYESYGGKSLHQQSHGESFLALFNHRLNDGLFILDEPEAALSPKRQLTFLSLLHDRIKTEDSQFIIATHSPILLSFPGATIYEFSEKGIQKVQYYETEHYKITKDFLESPEGFYRHLF